MGVRLLSTFASQMPPSAVGLLADTRRMFALRKQCLPLYAHIRHFAFASCFELTFA